MVLNDGNLMEYAEINQVICEDDLLPQMNKCNKRYGNTIIHFCQMKLELEQGECTLYQNIKEFPESIKRKLS